MVRVEHGAWGQMFLKVHVSPDGTLDAWHYRVEGGAHRAATRA
jgi:hypothetical protein